MIPLIVILVVSLQLFHLLTTLRPYATPLLVTLPLSLGLSLLITGLLHFAASQLGLEDRPGGWRQAQGKPVAIAGGLAVQLSVSITLLIVWLWAAPERNPLRGGGRGLVALLVAGAAVWLLGLVDDFDRLRGRFKLVGQILVAGTLTGFGDVTPFNHHVRFVRLFAWEINLSWFSFPFTVLLLLGAINALNHLNRKDGLLGSVGVIISVSLAAMAGFNSSPPTVFFALAMAGALLGFLRYNFPPASVYLGGGGSMFVGLVLGVLTIRSCVGLPGSAVTPAAPLGLWTIPLFGAVVAILRHDSSKPGIVSTNGGHSNRCPFPQSRRVYKGESVWGFSTKNSVSHREPLFTPSRSPNPFFKAGLDVRSPWGAYRALLVVSALCLFTAGGALASSAFHYEMPALLTAGGVVAVLVAGRGYLP